MDESTLVRAAQGGNLDAFNQLVLAYQELAYNVAFGILSEDASAEDATQNAFISAYRSIRGFRGGSFRAWLLRIVTNTCFDELRRRKRRPTTPLEPLDNDDQEIESPAWLADSRDDPEEAAEQAELSRAIERCVQRLPDEYRVVVVLVDIQGFDYREVAEALGKPLGTVKSRLARARLRLRSCLQQVQELLPVELRLEVEERA
ncbi:MAG: sigma-70 family RNA polymerase sigma factor [Anaerolineaceae bacterium]|nr:sigma-70 family RNA polymerase sigma factor [Anaerolineaceae bacterium]